MFVCTFAHLYAAVQGFRQQTQHWPVQPVQQAIAWLNGRPHSWVAADFGCGDAQLAASVPHKVHSLDLVASGPGVIACNMADTPLGKAQGTSAQAAELACQQTLHVQPSLQAGSGWQRAARQQGCACCLGEVCSCLLQGFLQDVVQALSASPDFCKQHK